MNRLLTIILAAALTVAVPASAARHQAVTVTLTAPGSYHITRPDGPLRSLYVLTHRCWAGSQLVENTYQALPWYSDGDVAADVGPYPAAGDTCQAFVWAWPDSTTPVSNTVTYAG